MLVSACPIRCKSLEAGLGEAVGIPAEDFEASLEPVECTSLDDLLEDARQALNGTHSCEVHAPLTEAAARSILANGTHYRS